MRFTEESMLPRLTLACFLAGLSVPAHAQMARDAFLATMPEGASRVSEIIGTTVIGSDIRRLGEVKDVVLDREGRAAAVVIASGGVLGVGERNVAVPFDSLLWNYDTAPTDAPASSNTGGVPSGGDAMQAKRADSTSPGPENVEATGTVGDPAKPNEGLRPQGATIPVTGNGAPTRALLRMTVDELRHAPEFQSR